QDSLRPFSEDLQATLLTNHRIAVLDYGASELSIFSPDGMLDTVVGRHGGGPGEFRAAQAIQRLSGDTLAVWDAAARRVSWIGPNGSFLRSWAHPGGGKGPVRFVGVLADGAVLVRELQVGSRVVAGEVEVMSELVAYVPSGEKRSYGQNREETRLPDRYRWFGWRLYAATDQERLAVGSSDSAKVRLLGLATGKSVVLRWPWSPTLVTDSLRSLVRELAGERNAAPAVTADVAFAEVVPAFGGILFGRTGNVWVTDFAEAYQAPNVAWVFDSSG